MSDSICPSYRLRLFQSVDLVGSTAFKARYSGWESGSPNPIWVTQIQHFYREFPKILDANFGRLKSLDVPPRPGDRAPSVWKTIGDEIIFCCRLNSLEHLANCTRAFMKALEDYGVQLDGFDRRLDVKGASWVAAFPAPNVSVDIASIRSPDEFQSSSTEQADEQDELRADKNPSEFDFLGQHIDAGFRSARMSSSDSLSMSLELAYLLAEAAHRRLLDGAVFRYHGRQSLKGVLNDRPYPMITIDMERKDSRRAVLQTERDITGSTPASPHHLINFLQSFMKDEGVEEPLLPRSGAQIADHVPSYVKYRETWENVREELEQRTEGESQAAMASEDGQDSLPPEINEALEMSMEINPSNPEESSSIPNGGAGSGS
ncbi:conserved hypothetical protein [Mesorhizobium plurifarium]|uniref:Uncharacterized protein n=1 Tax=Mesorhizobium plurifarium TaxID=69974 RepID=A0A090EGZ5_MESPL|nr:conserved hypothetical protein [Mesorhizobium plurifarium]